MLSPKKTKFRKQQKGRIRGVARAVQMYPLVITVYKLCQVVY